MSASTRVGSNIEESKYEIEATFEMKLDELKYDHMKTIDSLDIKISAITLNKPY